MFKEIPNAWQMTAMAAECVCLLLIFDKDKRRWAVDPFDVKTKELALTEVVFAPCMGVEMKQETGDRPPCVTKPPNENSTRI